MPTSQKILFVISKSTGYIALNSSYYKLRDNSIRVLILDDRGDVRSCFDSIEKFCHSNSIEYDVAKNKSCLDKIVSNYQPDFVFVCGWYWIINPIIIDGVSKGVFGIHNSLLPKYRGHAPLVWSIINGDNVVGASLFRIEKGVDSGKVFKHWSVENKGEYIGVIIKKLENAIKLDLGDVILSIISGENKGWEQNHSEASFSSKRTPKDGLIDWRCRSIEILRKIRALSSPYPYAYTIIEGDEVSIIEAELFEFEVFGEPGQVAFYTECYAIICCGKNEGIKVTKAKSENGNESINKIFMKISSPLSIVAK